MYLWTDHEISRQYREEIRREIRAARMGRGRKKFRLARALKWELARYGGHLRKRLRAIKQRVRRGGEKSKALQ